MARAQFFYVCEDCGARSLKWQGQCPDCGAWNTLAQQATAAPKAPARSAGETRVHTLDELPEDADQRMGTGLAELDRVLGGGLVLGSVVLIGGDPGIGKSTLLLQAAARLSHEMGTLYVTGEESPRQVGMRARRVGADAARVGFLPETCVEEVLAQAESARPRVIIIDSIQTMYSGEVASAPGALTQLRESTAQLVRYAKRTGTSVLLVGHVTKEGQIAGPRVLEHMVDTVLYFESDAGSRYRIVRAVKNRFGAANEIGVFAMTAEGLREVRNPSSIFLSRHDQDVSGSMVTVIREGSRPLLVEVQALVDESRLSNPRRVSLGLESSRLSLLLAVLHRHGGIAMYDQDVFVNVVGGVRVAETAADLPALLAAVSSFRNVPIPRATLCFGEVGLAGEIRPVAYGEERLLAAAKHGFERALVPAANAPKRSFDVLDVVPVRRVGDALDVVFE